MTCRLFWRPAHAAWLERVEWLWWRSFLIASFAYADVSERVERDDDGLGWKRLGVL